MHAATSSPSSSPATLDGYDLLRAAEIRLGDLLVPVGAQPARTDWALVLPSDTYLIGHRTTPEGLSPARLFHVYRAHSAPAPAPVPAPASYPKNNYTTPAVQGASATQLAQAALHLACALQLLAELQARSPSATPVPEPRDGGAA